MTLLTPQAVDVAVNLDQTWDDRYPLGDKGQVQKATLDINQAAFTAANLSLLNLLQNTAQSFNYRQYLTGTSAATATLTVNAITGTLGNWQILTDSLTNSGTLSGSGSLQVVASDNAGNVVSFPVQAWSILAVVQQHIVTWNPGWWAAPNATQSAGPDNNGTPNDSTSKFFPIMDEVFKSPVVKGWRHASKWHGYDAGIGTFTGSVGGATSGTLASSNIGVGHPTVNASYWVGFNTSTTSPTMITYRRCTLNGTALSWTGALPAGSITACHFWNTTLLDAIRNRLATQYGTPRGWILDLEVMSFSGGTRGNDKQIVPNYILSDPGTYGAGPDGAGGWWGPSVGDSTKNHLYSAATWRASVAGMYAATWVALGTLYASDPLCEGFMDQEPSAVVQAAFAGTQWPGTNPPTYPPGVNDSTYGSDTSYATRILSYLGALRAVVPNKNIILQNTYLATATPTQQLEHDMITGGAYIAPSTADTVGQSRFAAGFPVTTWGLQAYRGVTAIGSTYSGPDYSTIARAMVDLESGDYAASTGMADIYAAINSGYKASHVFLTYLSSAHWNGTVRPFIEANPLLNIPYPGNYP